MRRTPLEWIPYRVWSSIIYIFFAGLLVLGAFHFYLWWTVNKAATPAVSQEGHNIPKVVEVNRARDLLQEMEDSYKALLLIQPSAVDPSR